MPFVLLKRLRKALKRIQRRDRTIQKLYTEIERLMEVQTKLRNECHAAYAALGNPYTELPASMASAASASDQTTAALPPPPAYCRKSVVKHS
eukprot:12396635-Prorocentrum_lima.AAC.2